MFAHTCVTQKNTRSGLQLSSVHPVPGPSPGGAEGAVGCCGLLWVQGCMHRSEAWKDCDHKGLGVLLHRPPAADQSTQVSVNGKSGKEEAAGNVKWKPDATASH